MRDFPLNTRSSFYAIVGGGMLLAQCAIYRGDLELWTEAKKHMCEAPCQTKEERGVVK